MAAMIEAVSKAMASKKQAAVRKQQAILQVRVVPQ